jgi:hypothetical protein
MLDQIIGDQRDNLVNMLSSKLGVSGDQAGGFLSKLLQKIEILMGEGKLDVESLLKGDLSSLKSNLDMDNLGALLGGGKEKAEQGIDAVSHPIAQQLDKLDDPMGMLGGLLGGSDSGDLMSKAKAGLGGLLG